MERAGFCISCHMKTFEFSTDVYLFKVCNKNLLKSVEICSKLLIKIPERRYRRRSGAVIVNSEDISRTLF